MTTKQLSEPSIKFSSDTSEACPPIGPDGKPFVSAGKHIHNELTYRGIDFLLNSAIGVAFTYWSTRTKSGEKYFGKPVTGFFKKLLKPVLKSEEALNEGAKWGGMFTSIIIGGTTIIPPMTLMENKNNKKSLIRWIDEKIYGCDQVERDPKFQACYDAIDNEPKKDFSTGMAARLLVLAPMIAVTMIPQANKLMVKYLYNPIGNSSKWMCEKLNIRPKKLMEQGRTELADGDLSGMPKFLSDWDFIHRTVGFDLGLTFIYSFAHEAAYKSLAAIGLQKDQAETSTPTSTAPSLPAEPASASPEPATSYANRVKPASRERFAPTAQYTDIINRSSSTEAALTL